MTFSKTSIYLFIFFFAAMAVSPEPAFARDPDKAVSKRDSDGDGKVSDNEWKGSSMAFERIDGNGDGYITAKEFAKDWGISYTDDSNDSPAAGKGAGTGLPIADLHFHPAQNFTAGDAAQWFDANGVRWAGSGVKGSNMGGASTRKQYADALAGRYIAFGGQSDLNGIFKNGGLNAAEDAKNPNFLALLPKLEADLKSGAIHGIGEIFANTRASNPKEWMRRKMKIDAASNRALYALVGKYDAFITFHMHWDDDSVEQLEALIASQPSGKVLLNHCGIDSSASAMRAFFEKHANVYCELSARFKPKMPGKFQEREIFNARKIHSDWKQLIEDFSGRFMVGTDVEGDKKFGKAIRNVRSGLLANLSPETAEKVAYKNAARLFKLK